MIQLLAVDIDGTLLDSRGAIPDSHRAALEDASARGVRIVLATGRAFHFTKPIADALGLPLTLLVSNGAVIKTLDGTSTLRNLLARETALRVLDYAQGFEDSVAVVFDRMDARQIVFEQMDWAHPSRRGYYEKNRAFIANTSCLAEAIDEDPIQVMFNGSVEPMRTLAAALKSLPDAEHFSVATTEYEARDFSLIDITAPGCSKGATLARWTESLGIPRSDVLAVGDNLNDLEMLEFAGVAAVMGNASDSIKALGFHLTDSHDDGGLASVIRRFVFDGDQPLPRGAPSSPDTTRPGPDQPRRT